MDKALDELLCCLDDELSQLSLPYQYLNLLLEGVTIFSGVTMVAVETTVKVLRSFRKV